MISDITVDECIGIVLTWFKNAMAKYKITKDFKYLLLAHKCYEIGRHLKDYNDPLTWDELKQMKGKPIWVIRTEKYYIPHWAIVEDIIEWDSIPNGTLLLQPDDEELFLSDFGKTWQVYRKGRK